MIYMKIRVFVAAILSFILVSCSTQIKSPLEFEKEYLNNQVVLHIFEQTNTFKTTDPISICLTFRTDTEIVFPNNYNLRLYVKSNENWKEISEKPVERYPVGDYIFSPLSSPQMHCIFVEPDLDNVHQKYLLRLYVSGEMRDDENPKTVAAFLDINLRP